MTTPLTDAQFDAIAQAKESIVEAYLELGKVRDWSHREFVSDADLFDAPASLLAAVPDCKRVRSLTTAKACLAYAEAALPALHAAVEEGAKVGATGARRLRQSAEVIDANAKITQALRDVQMAAIFARHICTSMANESWSDCVDLS